jgi:hypothetical protein
LIVVDSTRGEEIGEQHYRRWWTTPNRDAYTGSMMRAIGREAFEAGRLAGHPLGSPVRDEWGARYHHPDDGDVDTWCGPREDAERMIAARYQGVAPWPHRSSLIRRFVIVTAPEVIP